MPGIVVGRYRLLRPLGQGGMGAVWRAHDTLLDRQIALKEIYLPGAPGPVDPEDPLVRRALREAQAAARLHHPGIVTVHDVVTDEGRPWIVMELVDGQSLAQAIQEAGLIPAPRTAEIGLRVLDALEVAHRAGVLHRDVKPANILLAGDRVVLTDFGIAAIDDATALTGTGQMIGSPAFLAPERINGDPATAAADLWALGVTLYAAVTGRSPFRREDTLATLAAILTSQPDPPAHAGRLWPVVKGLLTKDPAQRLTVEQARPLLEAAAHPPAVSAPPQRHRSRFAVEEPDPTAVAPPPTLAAPTERAAPITAPAAASPAAAAESGAATQRRVAGQPPIRAAASQIEIVRPAGARPAARDAEPFPSWAMLAALVSIVLLVMWIWPRSDDDTPPADPGPGIESTSPSPSPSSKSSSPAPWTWNPRGL
jgi:serine/threonine protein kinase